MSLIFTSRPNLCFNKSGQGGINLVIINRAFQCVGEYNPLLIVDVVHVLY